MYKAIVTGGTRGIGAAIALHLHHKGMQVVSLYKNNTAQANLFAKAYGIEVLQTDITNFAQVTGDLRRVQDRLGRVDVLVNNAGITADKMFHKMDHDSWYNVINTNLISCFNTTNVIINGMREQQFGRIINLSSINGLKGQVGQSNYAASKAGIIGFTKALALENANKGITINAIAPGYIMTDMLQLLPNETLQGILKSIPVGRFGKAEEVAEACYFLINAPFITGAVLNINGGQYL